MPTPRPNTLPPTGDTAPKDDGLFGPDSVTWRVMAGAVPAIAGTAAVAMQSLLPRAMHLFAQSSSYLQNPEQRGQLTQDYFLTIAYGDTAAAQRAGQLLRNIHHSKTGTDPATGETYHADEPGMLLWVHTLWVWALLRAAQLYGPPLTDAERDRFVAEQKTAARLVGLHPDTAPSTVAEMDAYLRRMRPQMAFTLDVVNMGLALAKHQAQAGGMDMAKLFLNLAAVDLIPPEMKALLGIKWRKADRLLARAGARVVVAGYNRGLVKPGALDELRRQVSQHAFGGRVRPPVAGALAATSSR